MSGPTRKRGRGKGTMRRAPRAGTADNPRRVHVLPKDALKAGETYEGCALPVRTASWLSVLNAKRSIAARGQAEKDDSTWIPHHSGESKCLVPTGAGRRRSLLQRVARCVSDSEAEKISPGNGRSYFGRR
jgi:hypothetical protein